jgi:hypothetical protein
LLIRLRSCRLDRERDHARGHEDALSEVPHAGHLFPEDTERTSRFRVATRDSAQTPEPPRVRSAA